MDKIINKNKVPKLRFGEFNNEWHRYKIKDTLKIKSGRDQKSIIDENGNNPILGTGGIIGKTNSFLYDKPSVLIGRKGTINKPQYMDTPFWTVDTLFYSEIHKEFLPKFIYYVFQNINWKKYDESTGVPSLTASTIENIKYYIPNLKEQQKIANFFTLIDKKINLQTQKVELLKKYKKALLEKIYKEKLKAIKLVNLKELAHLQGGFAFESKLFTKKGMPIIRISNINENIIDLKDVVYYNAGILIDSKFEVNKGDMLIAMSGATTGKFGIYNDTKKAYLNQRVGKLILHKKDIIYSYLYFLFELNSYNIQLKNRLVAGAQPNISPSDIEALKFKIPSINVQKNIIDIYNSISKKIRENENKLKNLKELKKGLLQKMFV